MTRISKFQWRVDRTPRGSSGLGPQLSAVGAQRDGDVMQSACDADVPQVEIHMPASASKGDKVAFSQCTIFAQKRKLVPSVLQPLRVVRDDIISQDDIHALPPRRERYRPLLVSRQAAPRRSRLHEVHRDETNSAASEAEVSDSRCRV